MFCALYDKSAFAQPPTLLQAIPMHNEVDYHPIVKLDLAMIGIDFAVIVKYHWI